MNYNAGDVRGQQNTRTPTSKHLDAVALLYQGAHPIPLCWAETPHALVCSCPKRHTEKRGEVNAQGIREVPRYKHIGKVPLVDWQKYQTDPPDGAQLHDWWGQWPNANAAILLEPSGLLVVDIDSHAADVEVRARGIGDGAIVTRGGKIKHIYYACPEGVEKTRRTRVGESGRIDILPSGYVVAPPSVHGDGMPYEWLNGVPDFRDLPEPPEWVLEELATASASAGITAYSGDLSGKVEGFKPLSKREERIASALSTLDADCKRGPWIHIGAMVLSAFDHGADRDEIDANIARGFDLWSTWSSTYPKYDHEEAAREWRTLPAQQRKRRNAIKALRDSARAEGRQLTLEERRKGPATMKSLFHAARSAGWVDPHPPYIITECKEVCGIEIDDEDLVEPAHMQVVPVTRSAPVIPPAPPVGGGGGGQWEYPEVVEGGSDIDFANLVARYVQGSSPVRILSDEGEVWRYDPNDGRWAHVSDEAIQGATAKLDKITYKRKKADGEWSIRTKYMSAGNVKGIASIVPVVCLREGFFKDAPKGAQFKNAFVQAKEGGSLKFLPPGPEHGQRLGVPYDYNESATCDRWLTALDQIFMPKGDVVGKGGRILNPQEAANECVDFLQEFVGACLMGWAPTFQQMLLLYGRGSNGKSVVIDVVAAMFPKEMRSNTTPQALSGRDSQDAVANLHNKRLCYFADIPAGDLLNSSNLKALIGGDTIEGREVYQRRLSFESEAGFFYSANELPPSRDNTDGFWRRIVALPMVNRFHKTDKGYDAHLKKRIIATELEGIYAWAIRGVRRLLERGHYNVPAVAHQTKQEWKRASNPFAHWVEECVGEVAVDLSTSNPAHWTTAEMLFKSYTRWTRESGLRPTGLPRFQTRFSELNLQTRRVRHNDLLPKEKSRQRRAYPVRLYAHELRHLKQMNAINDVENHVINTLCDKVDSDGVDPDLRPINQDIQ